MNKEERYEKLAHMLGNVEKIIQLEKEIVQDSRDMKNSAWKHLLVLESLDFATDDLKMLPLRYFKWLAEEHQMSYNKAKQKAEENHQILTEQQILDECREMVDLLLKDYPGAKPIFDYLENGGTIDEGRAPFGSGYIFKGNKTKKCPVECKYEDLDLSLYFLVRYLSYREILVKSVNLTGGSLYHFHVNKKLLNRGKKNGK